jgi:uncharacterized protein
MEKLECLGRATLHSTHFRLRVQSLQHYVQYLPYTAQVFETYRTTNILIFLPDDRYTDDVHYYGGSLRAIDLVDYCMYMTALNALPPVPAVFGDAWRGEWLNRLDKTEPWIFQWMAHPHDGDYWRHGSLRPDYSRIVCPTMIVAGWADGYRNNTFRCFERLQCEKNLLVGPWNHSWPEHSLPGPQIGLVEEMAEWFNRHLRDSPPLNTAPGRVPAAVSVCPQKAPIRVFLRRAADPEPDLDICPGHWISRPLWPPLDQQIIALTPSGLGIDTVIYKADVGTSAWNSCSGSLPWGQPLDQREDDCWSLQYNFPVAVGSESHSSSAASSLLGPVIVAGNPSITLKLSSDKPVAMLSIKLCCVLPDGTSCLVTRGFLNLTHRKSSTHPEHLSPHQEEEVTIELEATTWIFEVGQTLRLSLAGSDWPNVWSAPENFRLSIRRESVVFSLPTLDPSLSLSEHCILKPLPLVAHTKEYLPSPCGRFPATSWKLEADVLQRLRIARTFYGGESSCRDEGVACDWNTGEVGVSVRYPSNCWAIASTRYELSWPELSCSTLANMTIRSDEKNFDVSVTLEVTENGACLANKCWREVFPRKFA